MVVELQARFDEEANIRLANRMEEAGIHVTYGVMGLKTHCKVVLVVRQDFNGLRRYVHIGTGNYHPGTARLYCDLGLLVYDVDFGQDATELFNYLTTGYTPKRHYRKLLVAPKMLKRALLERIEREIVGHRAEQSRAAAVQDERPGGCRYRPRPLPGLAGRRPRRSARPRHLPAAAGDCRPLREHPGAVHRRPLSRARPRLLLPQRRRGGVFHRLGRHHACATSNRASRFSPRSKTPALRQELRALFEAQLADRCAAWELQADGSYRQRRPAQEPGISSQEQFIQLAERRQHDVIRLRKRKTKYLRVRQQKTPE